MKRAIFTILFGILVFFLIEYISGSRDWVRASHGALDMLLALAILAVTGCIKPDEPRNACKSADAPTQEVDEPAPKDL